MKLKKIAVLLLCILMLFSFSGCKNEQPKYSAAELCNMISRDLFTTQNVTVIENEQLTSYFPFSEELLKEWRVAVCDENEKHFVSAVFVPKDDDSEKIIMDSINKFVSQAAARLKNLNETEYAKLSSRLVYKLGDAVILVVTDDYPAAEKYLKDLGAKEYK
jgi:hypothetical protein